MPGDGKSPGFSTARCFSTARTRAIPGIGRSSRSGVRLIELARWHPVALVASGHLHKAHDFRNQGTRYVWALPPAFSSGTEPAGYPATVSTTRSRSAEQIGYRDLWFVPNAWAMTPSGMREGPRVRG